jgi:DNA invertase Pin-like site-specific DNA recombinase
VASNSLSSFYRSVGRARSAVAKSNGFAAAQCDVAWKLDRLSRSLKDLLHIMERVREAGAGFRSLTEAVDTTTAAGRMMMQMLGSFAEFEWSMVRERTRAGLAAARDRGAKVGRPAKLSAHQQQEIIRSVRDGSKTAADAARLFGLHRSSITRLLARAEDGSP